MELAKAGRDFLIVEKDNQVGGLAKTYIFKEGDLIFRTDNGPHRFYSKNPKLYDFIEGLLQEKWTEVKRQTRQYIGGKFYHYPVRPLEALLSVGPRRAARMVFDWLTAQIKYKILRRPIVSFEDYIVANFGRSLGRFNIINYTEKVWGVPASTIHPDWAKQRIRGLSIGFLIKAALGSALGVFQTQPLRTLVDVFHYPEQGTGLIYETIKENLEKMGYQIHLNSYPVRIRHNGPRITEVALNNNGQQLFASPRYLVESIPIKEFLDLLDPSPPKEILAAQKKINYRDQVYLFMTLDKDYVTGDQWIYFPEIHIPIGRISEMKNFSQKMSPHGKTSLFVEFFCFEGDEIWNKSKEELLELVVSYLEPLGFIQRSEVRNSYLIKQKKVYPIYDLNYKEYIGLVKNYLDQFENLFYIGRPGRFRYNNQDHSLEMGFMAARSIVDGRRYDLNEIGAEEEYQERGHIKGELPKVDIRFSLYIVFAGIATIVDFLILFVLTDIFKIWYFLSAVVSYLAGMVINFSLNKWFNFNNQSRRVFSQFGIFAGVAVIGLGINQLILYFLVETAGWHYLLAKAASVFIVMWWSFWGHKHATFAWIK